MFHPRFTQFFALFLLASTYAFSATAEDYPFRSDDPIGRAVVSNTGDPRTILGYFCLHREADDEGTLGCVRTQFASSAEDQISHDMMGNLSSTAWVTVGPIFNPATAKAFAVKTRGTPEGGTLFNRVWDSGFWDRSEEGWQYKPKEIASKDLQEFSRLLNAEVSAAASLQAAQEAEEKDPELKQRKNFVGWWLDTARAHLVRMDVSPIGTLVAKTYWIPRPSDGHSKTLARKGDTYSEDNATLKYSGKTDCTFSTTYHGECRYLNITAPGHATDEFAMYHDGDGRLHIQRYAAGYSSWDWAELKPLSDDEVAQNYKLK